MSHRRGFPYPRPSSVLAAGGRRAGRRRCARGPTGRSSRSWASVTVARHPRLRRRRRRSLLHAGDGGYQFVSDHVWAPVARHLAGTWASTASRSSWSCWPPCCSRSCSPGARTATNPRAFVAWMLLLEAACIGSFISLDLILFFLFFELTLVPAYFLIAGWGYARRGLRRASSSSSTRSSGSAFLLVGILVLAFLHQSQTGRAHLLAARARAHPLLGDDRRSCSSWPSPRPSPSRRRSSRSTPGRPTPTPRRRPAARWCWPACWPSSAPTASPLRPEPVPPGLHGPGPAALDPGRHRHPLRRHRRLRPARPEAAGGLLVAGPDRLHRARHLRLHHPGPDRRRAAHGQPRAHHRRPVPAHRLDLRAPRAPGR